MTCKAKRRLCWLVVLALSLLWCFRMILYSGYARYDKGMIIIAHESKQEPYALTQREGPSTILPSGPEVHLVKQASSATDQPEHKQVSPVDGSWKAEQDRRKAAVMRGCAGWREAVSDYTPSSWQEMTSLLVDDKHKAIYCYVPKAACTNWKRLWMILTGLTEVEDPMEIHSGIPHQVHNKMRLVTQKLTRSQIQKKLETYTKMIVVRHPFERLLSAYLDKFVVSGNSYYMKNFARPIMKKFRGDDSQVPETGDGLTFGGFVRYVISLKKYSYFDEHWKPISELCYPCAIRYDVIVKYETLIEDSERFLRLIGAPADLHFPPANPRNTSRVLKKYFADIPRKQQEDLFWVYKKDFKIFEYDAI
ncbi:LOW QUALITY PROTEIN: carbohydrate sulfotransferase 11-like [Penaeus monodon]|uniref:LOW QUALITY PROTEIN: carbohydrate sulfotransferase 11-like n=1 Tax=Penaeus monodon TaxID=6687 RepID=UPI0018A7DD54|nr:LOW QUALITY PROTEIN: carbohydrate sulfotransferase 11-like [Penaeus monodon]